MSPARGGERRRPAATPSAGILTLSLVGFFGIFSTTISKSPVLPLFVKSLSGSDTVIGIIAAISPLAGILFSFPVGMLADRWGKKRLLLVAACVFVIAPLLYLVVQAPYWLIPIRFFHGIATAILGPVASAFIASAYPDSKGEKMGLYSSATLVGRTLAPLLGGAIISWFVFFGGSYTYRAVYGAAFLLSLPVLLLILTLKKEKTGAADSPSASQPAGMPHPRQERSGAAAGMPPAAAAGMPPGAAAVKRVTVADFGRSLGEFLRNRRLLGTSLVEMATYFAYGVMETYLPIYLAGQGVPAYQIGLVFSLQILSIALTKPLFGKLADTIDRRVQILAGIASLAAFVAVIPLFTSMIAIAAIGVLFGLAISVSTVATSAYVADVARQESLGASLGALSSIMDIGQSSGPFIAGIMITALSIGAGFFTAAAVCVLAALLFALLAFRKQAWAILKAGENGRKDTAG
ncbi:MAG: MFS transporter [Spirochaetia bacterium]|jgi:MFS family permease